MSSVTVRVPATTANLGPGFDCFGCALTLYTDLTLEESGAGLRITGCDPCYAGPDNLAYQAYLAVMQALGKAPGGLALHIDAHIPVCRGLGSSAALLAAAAVGANALHGSPLTTEQLLAVTTVMEGHPDNLAPALLGGLTAAMMDGDRPLAASFPLHPDWKFLAMVPEFPLSTAKARAALPDRIPRTDGVFNVSHGALTLKALELGDPALLRAALDDRLHQNYRKHLIPGYDDIARIVAELGGAFCLSGAGPTLLCITRQDGLEAPLARQLAALPGGWQVLPLRAEVRGAYVLREN